MFATLGWIFETLPTTIKVRSLKTHHNAVKPWVNWVRGNSALHLIRKIMF